MPGGHRFLGNRRVAGTGRKWAIACAVALCLSWGGGAAAVTVIAGPGTPETLIQDAHLTIASSLALHRSVPPPPARTALVERATVAAAYAGCVAAGSSAATSVGSSVGFLWVAAHCLRDEGRAAEAEPAAALRLAGFFLPPPPAPYWPAAGVPTRLPLPHGGGGGPRPVIAPVPLPAPGIVLPVALGILLALRRRRSR